MKQTDFNKLWKGKEVEVEKSLKSENKFKKGWQEGFEKGSLEQDDAYELIFRLAKKLNRMPSEQECKDPLGEIGIGADSKDRDFTRAYDQVKRDFKQKVK